MPSLVDCRYQALLDQGFGPGHVNEMLLGWLQLNGATSDNINDAWIQMLESQGIVPPVNKTDGWYELLGLLGYEGHINDREMAFWCGGGILGPQPLTTDGGEILTTDGLEVITTG